MVTIQPCKYVYYFGYQSYNLTLFNEVHRLVIEFVNTRVKDNASPAHTYYAAPLLSVNTIIHSNVEKNYISIVSNIADIKVKSF